MRIRIRLSGKSLGSGWASVPQPVSTRARHWFGLWWFSTAIVLVVWMSLLGYRQLQDRVPFAKQADIFDAPALLWVDRQGTDLRISWNRSVSSFTRAKAGLLSIKDGDSLPRQLHLDADQLRTGSVLYSPLSNQVQFRLELRQPDDQNVSESVMALSALRSPVASKKMTAEMPISPADTATVAPKSTPTGAGQLPAEKKPSVPVRTDVFPLSQPRAEQTPAGPRASGGLVPDQVVQQVLPDVPRKARDTIRGTVRVRVRVRVDLSGSVVGATLAARGPSPYFAKLALRAARGWRFSPTKVDGRDVSSEWILRFEFGRTATKIFPARVSPWSPGRS